MADKYGLEHLAFFTVTFPDPEPITPKEASRRFNSLNSNVLKKRYRDFVSVYERGGKTLRPHFHLVVACDQDVRSGANFAEFEAGDYSSANAALRAEWAFWRDATNYNGRRGDLARYSTIGRTEFLPVKSTADGIRKYVGKYIEKHMEARLPEDKGVRLLRMSAGLSRMTVKFAWHSPRAALWRMKVAEFASSERCASMDALKVKFGRRWAYLCRERIMRTALPPEVSTVERTFSTAEGPLSVRLCDLEESDRQDVAERVGKEFGIPQAEAYARLFQPELWARHVGSSHDNVNFVAERPGSGAKGAPVRPDTEVPAVASPAAGHREPVPVERIMEAVRLAEVSKPSPFLAIVPSQRVLGA